jgi:DNA mismatch repair protein MLH1
MEEESSSTHQSNADEACASNQPAAKGTATRSISVLPREVVDRIAAGEVVQRPAAAIKELLENCLDAGSTHIVVHIENGGLSKISISDNGCGIPKSDLALAATRHATSKLNSVEDFKALDTFGFRGEALASISMVSRLTVTSRTPSSPVGFVQTYKDGMPVSKQPKPSARKQGTTIVIQDLFYNVPHRHKTFQKKENDEYNRILDVVKSYAIHYAHVGFVCERTRSGASKTVLVDLNTSQLPAVQALIQQQQQNKTSENQLQTKSLQSDSQIDPADIPKATKQVMAHVFGSNLEPCISHFDFSQSGKDASSFSYTCQAYVTSPSYESKEKSTRFVSFVNDRLVDCMPLKKVIEETYSNFTKNKPILVVKVSVPGTQVDINVHPSKRQVALMYQEELCTAIANQLREKLASQAQDFKASSVAPIQNPYRKRKQAGDPATQSPPEVDKPPTASQQKKKRTPPSQLIRTSKAAPVGAIEPFLVSTQSSAHATQSQSSQESNPSSQTLTTTHKTDCLMLSQSSQDQVDMSQPGAFASAIRCDCGPPNGRAVLTRKPVVRPKRVIPTQCTYASVVSLRKRVNQQASTELTKQLRDAHFVGVVSHQRSMLQCGENVVMVNHLELAKELFYQLALARFGGGAVVAHLGHGGSGGVNVQDVIAQALEVEDQLVLEDGGQRDEDRLSKHSGLLAASDINSKLAEQAATCLLDNADMLEEYFMIRIEKQDEGAILTSLPVLLDGHAPPPHGLPIFLLRLATRVDWSEERQCFGGICRELGNYYASPSMDLGPYIQHTLFPAISYLLLPPENLKTDGNFTVMTRLSTLYKVFERC